jgi:hypothetical protein
MPNATSRNPFATRYVRPGALEYLFPLHTSAASLLEKLERNRWWGQITGPHGTGKSTFVHTLIPLLTARGRQVELIAMRSDDRRWPAGRSTPVAWGRQTQIVVDGYEQLPVWTRGWLRWQCQRRGAGLLLTSHHSVGLPELWQTDTSLRLACDLTRRWLTPGEQARLGATDIARAFERCNGNLRELWFTLYDQFEAGAASESSQLGQSAQTS